MSVKPKEKTFKERYDEEIELEDQKALALKRRDEESLLALKLKYLITKKVQITKEIKEVKSRPSLKGSTSGRLLWIISEEKSMRIIYQLDLLLLLTGILLPRTIAAVYH